MNELRPDMNVAGRATPGERRDDRLSPIDRSSTHVRPHGVDSLRRLRPYPSDLSDAQWRDALRLLSAADPHRSARLRRVLDAVNYRWCTGCSWRMLPHDFGPWQTVYRHFRKWQGDGLLPAIREIVLQRRIRNAGKPVRRSA